MWISKDQLRFRRKAEEFARLAHKDQVDKNGVEYVQHPIAVAGIVSDLGYSEDAVLAAVLHDVVEDTVFTLSSIRYRFGDRVADLVDGLSRRKHLGETYFDYIRRIRATDDEELVVIKLADLSHNSREDRQTDAIRGMVKTRYAKAVRLLSEGLIRDEMLDQIFEGTLLEGAHHAAE